MTGKTYWITGASSGIGLALALRLARSGHTVALTARSADDMNAAVADEPAEVAGRMVVVPADVTDDASLAEAYAAVKERFGVPDTVVANAGTHAHMPPSELDFAAMRAVLEVNLVGAVRTLSMAAKDMMARGSGHLAGVASLAGYRGLPFSAAYGASKSGLITFLEGLRFDLEPYGVDVTVVNPGFVKTPLTDRNPFPMPMLIEVDAAVDHIETGLRKRRREIHFPPAFSWTMKLLRILPYPLYHRLVRRMTKSGVRS